MAATTIKSVVVDSGISVFYRTASPANKPAALTIPLLHGLQTSSHQYRHLIPLLARHYNVVVPDLTGFGFLTVSPKRKYTYTFAALSRTIGIFDYRAPVLLRIALERPTASTAIITQNGDAYIEGLGSAWAPIQKYQETGSAEDRAAQESELKVISNVYG
ncbi:alpha/beta hydrolase-like protein [Mycena vulgaris]|nr:alpha/beta hydrolase-like protein [Mycena vulgaris]